ncbi:MAG TPA: bifunctional UDP-N-acetylglucosamine diphosphorylase/glucosamine-1-phosphate N-acetyltransferase GlmU [Thermoanaerobaculia bacterium]|nr:bifunctional UDP-N-acetylglucosamine diphosphorylase/glucosamine-1-phosphate N-acetyltransferase GlmU [Thermoanaerobaculia bacterium]
MTGASRPSVAVVVLAAGQGVRMRSERPKVLHEAAGRALLGYVLDTARDVTPLPPVVVVGHRREAVSAFVAGEYPSATCVVQEPALGTGDAVRVALAALPDSTAVVVLSGDVPLLPPSTVARLVEALREEPSVAVAFLTARVPGPNAYGRVVREGSGISGEVARIVEVKDASDAEKSISEINAGVYAFDRAFLSSALPKLTKANAAGEYYLTDVLGIAVSEGRRVAGILSDDADEWMGVNTRADLARVDASLRLRAAGRAMNGGATLVRPETITLDATVVLESDTVVEPFVTLLGATRVGSGTRIGQGCVVTDSTFGRNVVVKPYCVVEKAVVGADSVVGPFARLREGTELAEDVHVGNFVETKKARLSRGVKANHLTYLGDTVIGERTNVGAGVITCNYDGFRKYETTIGADVFVGSDTQLVAPVTVGDGAVIAAGTTVTRDVPGDALAVARAPQNNVEGGGAAYRERKKGERKGRA